MFNERLQKWLASRHFLLIILGGFVVSRLLLVLLLPVTPTSDGAWYVGRAIDLADGRGYAQNGVATAYWPVGYPAFIALLYTVFGKNLLFPLLANVALGALTLVLMDRLARLMFADELAGRLAVLFYALYPNQLAYTATPLTEILFTFVFMGAILLFLSARRRWHAVLSGVAFGLATLIKAQTILFPAFVLCLWAWSHRRSLSVFRLLKVITIIYATALLVVMPWTIRNYLVFDRFVLVSTNGGAALYVGNSPNATGAIIPDEAIPAELRPTAANQVETDKALRRAALEWIKEHPLSALKLVPLKIWHLWAPDGEGEWGFQSGYAKYDQFQLVFRAIRLINQLFYVSVVILFLIGCIKIARHYPAPSPWVWLPPIIVLYTTFISAVFSGQSRYHFPAVPWMMMYTGWLLLQWSRHSNLVRVSAAGKRQMLPGEFLE